MAERTIEKRPRYEIPSETFDFSRILNFSVPGICHGVAGSGYVFLVLHKLTGDKSYLQRAWQFMNFIYTDGFSRWAKRPDCPYSLYEGLAGTTCFAADLLRPEKAKFPFFEV